MRPSCLLCVCKHLGSASVLYGEYRRGYSGYFGFILGELEQAWQESEKDYPDLSTAIYAEKKSFESDPASYELQIASLTMEASRKHLQELKDGG
jgi:hypothetical protein